MFHCPVGVWVIEQRAIMLSTTVRSPTVHLCTFKVYQFNSLVQMGSTEENIHSLTATKHN